MEDTKLDRSQIIHMALQMMQSDGIDGLTMRKLAARLNIRAPTLYWYFPDRSTILREVIKTLLRETFHRVPDCDDWRLWLHAFGTELWHTNRKSPYVTMLLQSRELNDQEIFQMAIDLLNHHANRMGIDPQIFLRAHSDIQALVLGWSVFLQAGVMERVGHYFDADRAVADGIDGIISVWEARLRES